MDSSFLARRVPYFGNRAVLILCMIFFLYPFGTYGAKLALQGMKNDMKDWLPDGFTETKDLAWAGRYFVTDQGFVLLSWQGCSEDDERFRTFVKKLQQEVAPPTVPGEASNTADEDELTADQNLRLEIERARRVGDQLGLYTIPDDFQDWGGQQERWLKGRNNQWYFITPSGELHQWKGRENFLGWANRSIQRLLRGKHVNSSYIDTFGTQTSTEADPTESASTETAATETITTKAQSNPFYEDPRKLTARVLKSIDSGPEVLKRLTEQLQPVGEESEQRTAEGRRLALERLKGILYSDNGKLTGIMVTLSEAGLEDTRNVLGRGILGKPRGKLVDLAVESGILPPPIPPLTPWGKDPPLADSVLRAGGPLVDNVAIDEEGQITLVRLVGLSIGLGIVLSYLCFRSFQVTTAVFLVGAMSAVVSLGIVGWTNGNVDAILMSMPSLVYVLGISGAVHIVNYYRDAVREHGVAGASERALAHAWWPCTLAAITTALGLVSLNSSNVVPISNFGLYSAIGVLASLTFLFAFLPSALAVFPPRFRNQSNANAAESEGWVAQFWEMTGRFVIRWHWPVTLGCVLLMVAIGMGLTKVQTSVKLLKLFDPSAKVIKDYAWIEDQIGQLVPMELIVHFSPDLIQPTREEITQRREADTLTDEQRHDFFFRLNTVERVEVVGLIQAAVSEVFGNGGQEVVGNGMSVASFVPDVPFPNRAGKRMRGIFDQRIEQAMDELLAEEYLAIDDVDNHELWRISIRVAALSDVDYGAFVSELKKVVEPILLACRYREEILRKLDEEPGTVGYLNSKLLILGAANPGGKNPADLAALWKSGRIGECQSALFARTLNRLLHANGYRQTLRAKQTLFWHDPQTDKFAQLMKDSPEKWAEFAARFDCLVFAADHPLYDLPALQERSEHFVDVRSHQFDITSQSPLTHLTAKQRHETTGATEKIRVTYTGVVPIVYKAQHTLLNSLVISIFWAFVMIAGVMVFLLGNWERPFKPLRAVNLGGGALSMLPNVFPVVLVFGAMGHLGIVVDIGSMMCAGVAMGVAVDDTIHFLTWFRNGVTAGLPRHEAVILAYRRVGAAMTQTTLIGGLGFSVLSFSTFTPTQRFGTLMLTLLSAALLGDLVMLPGLLASPLGRFFCPPGKRNPPREHTNGPAMASTTTEATPSDSPEMLETGSGPASPHTTRLDGPHRQRSIGH